MLIKPRGCVFGKTDLPVAGLNMQKGSPTSEAGMRGNGPMADPVAFSYSVESLTSKGAHEVMVTQFGKWQEGRREAPLCSVFDFENGNPELALEQGDSEKWQQD